MSRPSSSSTSAPFFLSALSSLLCCLALVAHLPTPTTAQPFTPQVPALTSCPTGQTFFRLGDANYTDYTAQAGTAYYGQSYGANGAVMLTPFNNTDYGATITQLQLALGDNSGLVAPVHLRMGVYLLFSGAGGTTAQLLGQTDEITLYPGYSQTLSAALLSPVTLLSENLYALGMWGDGNFYPGFGTAGTYEGDGITYDMPTGLYGSGSVYFYSDNTMPTTLSSVMSGYQSVAMAAVGCFNPASYAASNTKAYEFCISAAQFIPVPATSKTDASVAPITNTLSITGVATVSTAATTATSTGTGYTVLSLTATMATNTMGSNAYSMQMTPKTAQLKLSATATVQSVTASQLLYLTSAGAASSVDANGLALQTDTGVTFLVRYNSSIGGYTFTAANVADLAISANGGQLLSSFSAVQPAVYGAPTVSLPAACGNPYVNLSSLYVPDVAVSCPAGTSPVSYGDSQLSDALESYEGGAYVSGNYIFFRPIIVNQPAVTLYTLQYPMMQNPNTVVHMRMGVFNNTGTAIAPQYALLAQTNQLTFYSPGDVMVTANLPTPLTVSAGQYYIGVWFDVPVYAGFWEYGYVYDAQVAFGSVSATGSFPASLTPTADYQGVPSAVLGCAADGGAAPKQFYVCARFAYTNPATSSVQSYNATAIVTASAKLYSNSFGSYYALTGGRGQFSYFQLQPQYGGYGSPNPLITLDTGSLSFPAPNRLYVPSTTSGNVVVDTDGIQFMSTYSEFGYLDILRGVKFSAYYKTGSVNASVQFQSTKVWYSTYSSPAPVSQLFYANINYVPYTANMQLPSCVAPSVGPANLVSPAPLPLTCDGIGSMAVRMGDGVASDFTRSSLQAGLIYPTQVTAPATTVVSQVAVTLADSTTMPPTAFRAGLYSATGALLSQSASVSVYQVLDGVVYVTLTPAVTLAAGSKYTIAIQANSTLNIPLSATTPVPVTATYASTGLPATIAVSGSPSLAVPLVLLGCAQATHSFCGIFEYYQPAMLFYGQGATTSYIYQGLLATNGVSGADATYGAYQQVSLGSGHVTAITRSAATAGQSVSGFSALLLNNTGRIYTAVGATSPLDAAGLSLQQLTDGSIATLAYSSSFSGVGLTSQIPWSVGSLVASTFNVSSLASTGGTIPGCSTLQERTSVGVQPALPVCAAGQSAYHNGDDINDDYAYTATVQPNFIWTYQFTTDAQYVSLSQVGIGVSYNPNTVGHVKMALYAADNTFIAATNELMIVNPIDETLVGTLDPPVTLTPDTTYLIAYWSDVSLIQNYQWEAGYEACGQAVYGTSWPGVIPSGYYICSNVAMEAFGCTVPAPSNGSSSGGGGSLCPAIPSSSSSSTGAAVVHAASSSSTGGAVVPAASSSSTGSATGGADSSSTTCQSDHSLSNGAVAGIVVGCVVGTNLLLLLCLALCFAGRLTGKAYDPQSDRREVSKLGSPSVSDSGSQRVEMGSIKPQTVVVTAQ